MKAAAEDVYILFFLFSCKYDSLLVRIHLSLFEQKNGNIWILDALDIFSNIEHSIVKQRLRDGFILFT